MKISEVKTGFVKEVQVLQVQDEELKHFTSKKYFFTWKKEQGKAAFFKLCLKGDEVALGLIALVDHPTDYRFEIKLLACSRENFGKDKIYDGIAGCLIGFACKEAVKKFGNKACVSLLPKTVLREHYKAKYGFLDGGHHLFVEGTSLLHLLNEYYL